MASIYPTKSGYRAQVFVQGQRDTKQFRTQREAKAWAAAREVELRESATLHEGMKHTLGDAFVKYSEEVSPLHKGVRWEQAKLLLFAKQMPASRKILTISAADVVAWRDARLQSVSPASVLREMKLLSSVFEAAKREWLWVDINPVRDIRKPRSSMHRDRTITRSEIRQMLNAAGYRPGRGVRTVYQSVAVAMLFALRTGMRAGEISDLKWADVHADYCRLHDTKNGSRRDVPLTPKAQRLLRALDGWDFDLVFGLKSQTLSSMFKKCKEKAGLDGFTFHDTRHTAATWMSRKLDVLTLCKMFGWSNPKMAMVYYNPKASDIVKMLI